MAELVTLSLRERPGTLQRKLISAPCIRNLVLSVTFGYLELTTIGEGRDVD